MERRDPPPGLRARLAELYPGARLLDARPLGPDSSSSEGDATRKAIGYGAPLAITLRDAGGVERRVVFRTQAADDYGHDRRSDRAQNLLLAYDTFSRIPRHVRALDVGALAEDGRLISLGATGEPYLLTDFVEGRLYAADLREVARRGRVEPLDLARVETLARYLVVLHRERGGEPARYRRAVRDLLGHGEGIFGVVDGYPPAVPNAPERRLRAIEERALAWRWRLRGFERRVARTHGDFHPFNVLFGDGSELTLLDASRGSIGEPADDVTAMAINFVFFALERPAAWPDGLGRLWRRFFAVYLDESGDRELGLVAAPFLAWRALVLASPRFYPALAPEARDRLLGFAERSLDAERFEPGSAEALFP